MSYQNDNEQDDFKRQDNMIDFKKEDDQCDLSDELTIKIIETS